MSGVPFDEKRAVIPHEFGCVLDPENGNMLEVGLYVAGWIKRGPVGIVDATLRDSMETFKMLKHHLDNEMLPNKYTSIEDTLSLFQKPSQEFQVIDKTAWSKIKAEEINRGTKMGKIKEKIIDRSEIFSIAKDETNSDWNP